MTTELRRLLDELKLQAERGDYSKFHRTDHLFHRAVVASNGLDPLLKSWEIVAAELDEWILGIKKNYWPNLMALYREHVLLLDAWLADNDSVAEQATHLHLEAGWHRLKMADGTGGDGLDPVQRAVSFMATHYASSITVAWVAQHVSFVSTSQLGRLFQQRMGIAPMRYLKKVRLERAAQLLRSSADPVSLIARNVGCRNASQFVRDFRRMFNATPLAFRKQRGKGK